MHAIIDQNKLGPENYGKPDFSIFIGKVRVQKVCSFWCWKGRSLHSGSSAEKPVLSEYMQKFIRGEQVHIRENYKQTEQISFGEAAKIQEFKYDSIPYLRFKISSDKTCNYLERRIIYGKVRHGTHVQDVSQVNAQGGKFQLIPQVDLSRFLSDPLIGAIYLE